MKYISRLFLSLILLISLLKSSMVTIVEAQSQNDTEYFSNLVLFVQFSDTVGNFMTAENTQKILHYYTDETYSKSLVSYMNTISYGKFHVDTYMPQLKDNSIQPIVLQGTRDSYNDKYTLDTEVLEKAKNIVPSSIDLDRNNDGVVDNITYIFAGEVGERFSIYYPQKYDYNSSEIKINDKSIGCINVQIASDLFAYGSLSGPGVIAHEFMHSLGYPDLYHETGGDPVSSWDIMAQATVFMSWPLAYLRSWKSNWLSIATITDNQQNVTLVPSSQSSGNRAYILKTPLSDSEFFVVEYRQKSADISNGLDYKVPGSGLIIYRINTSVENLNNHYNENLDGVYVFREGETSVTAATYANLSKSFFSKECGRTSFGNVDMNAKISDNALVYSDGQNSGIVIDNIGSAGDSISFNVSFADMQNVGVWNNLGGSILSQSDNSVLDMAVNGSAAYPNILLGTYSENLTNNISVYGYVDGKWSAVTNPINDYSYNNHLTYYQGIPYILYSDTNDKFKLVKYENGSWKIVFDAFTENIVSDAAMVAASDGIYISFNDGTVDGWNDNTLRTYKYVPEHGATEVYSMGKGNYAQIHMSASGTNVFVSCRDAANSNKPVVLSINAASNKEMKVPSIQSTNTTVYTDGKNIYLLCHQESEKKYYLFKYSDDLQALIQLGDGISVSNNSLAFSVYNGMPLLQADTLNQSSIENSIVWRYESGVWTKEGLSLLSNAASESSMLVIGNECYIAVISNNVPYLKHKSIHLKENRADTTPEVTNISITVNKANYKIGESFSASDIAVAALQSNMNKITLDSTQYHISGFDTSTSGIKDITVQYGNSDITTTYQINVSNGYQTIPVVGISINKSSIFLKSGETDKLTATVTPTSATNKAITYSSSNNTVAEVDQAGTITALTSGTADIVVKTNDGNKIAVCKVTVTQPVLNIHLNKDVITLITGSSDTSLSANIEPYNASNKKIIWSSNRADIASVDQNGKVTAKSAGTAYITAISDDGGRYAVCTVNVVDPIVHVNSISLNTTSLILTSGRTTTLYFSLSPDNAADRRVYWESNDSSVASVDGSGNVFAGNPGTTTIVATAADGYYSASCTVTVLDNVAGFVERLYETALDRRAEPSGLNNWTSALKGKAVTGSYVGGFFLLSQEFNNKNYCNRHFVEHLYAALMDREPDSGGLNNWCNALNSGISREFVINQFLISPEFTNICTNYGIVRGNGISIPSHGTVQLGPCSMGDGMDGWIQRFAERLYTKCLARNYENAGIREWINALNYGMSGSEAARGFFFSSELISQHLSNSDFVERLYNTFFDRPSDAGGKSAWIGALNRGVSRESVFNGFASSQEWHNFCMSYGITA